MKLYRMSTIETRTEVVAPDKMELTALEPLEMVNAQQQLITWCDGKIVFLKKEIQELSEAIEMARKNNWRVRTVNSQHDKAVSRLQYFEKIKAALLEGYYIVPNFPIQMFAIRTCRKKVKEGWTRSKFDDHQQKCVIMSIGEGDYKNPFPYIGQRDGQWKDGQEIQSPASWATSWDKMEFPITMAKPRIMEATNRAMALKIFDQIGIMPATKKEDPVIIGQVMQQYGNITKTVSFMIAWHLNTNDL